jgi:hypothetical protein
MNLTAEIGLVMNDVNNNQQYTQIHCALISNQPITDLLIYLVPENNKFIDALYPGIFPSTISYLCANYNSDKLTVTFVSLSLVQFNPVIVLERDVLKLFNIR